MYQINEQVPATLCIMAEHKAERPADRLKKARKNASYKSAAAFAAAHDITEVTYRSAENGTRGLTLANAKAWAPILGVTWQWLMDGDGHGPTAGDKSPKKLQTQFTKAGNEGPVPDINPATWPEDVPIYSGAVAGEDGLFEFNADVIGHAPRPPRIAGIKDVYALIVLGESMSPWREHGQKVYVHPRMPVSPMDYVVVQLKQESDGGPTPAYIKRLVRRTANDLRLFQFNPREEKTIPMKKVASIHRIIDWEELFGIR